MYGDRLRNYRKQEGYSQKDISAALDVPQSSVSAYEKQIFPSLEYAHKFAAYIGTPLDEILFPEQRPPEIDLSEQEKELLLTFRSLSEKDKHTLLKVNISFLEVYLSGKAD